MRRLFMITLLTLVILEVGLIALEGQTPQPLPRELPSTFTPAPDEPVQKPNNFWPRLAIIIATLFPLGVKIFKWLGIDLEETAIYPILVKIIEIIAGVEEKRKSLPGYEKKNAVVDFASKQLTQRELKLLNKRFGSLDTAVQAAYEISSTAKKKAVNIAAGGK